VAARAGTVIFSGNRDGYGRVIIIEHASDFVTVYAHNSKNIAEAGDEVAKGQLIGEVGNTGRSTGPHLHFEIRYRGNPVDPMKKNRLPQVK
jgi:murein DD-endopeptidase MepM/ murein hydrolase activator NlpD